MKKIVFGGLLLLVGAIAVYAFVAPARSKAEPTPPVVAEGPIKWYSWGDALAANQKVKKKLFLDMYTDWCGWCKKMDASTFQDPKVAAVMNKYFYAVKFDAEQKAPITYNGTTFKFIAQGSRGVHELAYALLDGQLGYPAFVYLNEKQERVTISPGYKTPDQIIPEMEYVGGDYYTKMSFEDFLRQRNTAKK